MLIVFHVVVAIATLIYTAYLYLKPSRSGIRVSYGLTSIVIASGTYLVISRNSPLLSACLSGLIYLAVVYFGIAMAKHKLTVAEARAKTENQI